MSGWSIFVRTHTHTYTLYRTYAKKRSSFLQSISIERREKQFGACIINCAQECDRYHRRAGFRVSINKQCKRGVKNSPSNGDSHPLSPVIKFLSKPLAAPWISRLWNLHDSRYPLIGGRLDWTKGIYFF